MHSCEKKLLVGFYLFNRPIYPIFIKAWIRPSLAEAKQFTKGVSASSHSSITLKLAWKRDFHWSWNTKKIFAYY